MPLLRKSTAIAAALTLLASPVLAQTEASPPATVATQDQGTAQPDGMGEQGPDAMRDMMREMMMEMMHENRRMDGKRGARAERRDGGRWHHAGRRDGKMRDGHRMRGGPGDMRRGMMHSAGMKIVFAIADADGDGALSLTEIQDFHARIFKAVDQNDDGKVDLLEIEGFFHESDDETAE